MKKEFLEIKCTTKLTGLAVDSLRFLALSKEEWEHLLAGAEVALLKEKGLMGGRVRDQNGEDNRKCVVDLITIAGKILNGDALTEKEILKMAYGKRSAEYYEIMGLLEKAVKIIETLDNAGVSKVMGDENAPEEIKSIVKMLGAILPGVRIKVGKLSQEDFDLEELTGVSPKVRRDN